VVENRGNPLDTLCARLEKLMAYGSGESDLGDAAASILRSNIVMEGRMSGQALWEEQVWNLPDGEVGVGGRVGAKQHG
jgi:hypothetical protein